MLVPWLVRGFVATVLLTTLLTAAQRLGLTRMSLPYLLGTMFTPDRDRARLIGQQPDPVSLHHALDCLVHPQIATEAFPSVILEAHACGRPVLASELDGIPEAWNLGALGQLVRAGDATALAQAMIAQSEDPPLTPEEQNAAHTRVASQASLPVQAQRMADLYRRLMAK